MTFEAFLLILKEDQWCCSSLFLLTTFQPSLWKKHWIFLIVLKDLQLMCLLFTSLKCIQLFSPVLECHLCYSRFPLCCFKWKCFEHFFPLLTFWSTCCNDFSVFCILKAFGLRKPTLDSYIPSELSMGGWDGWLGVLRRTASERTIAGSIPPSGVFF